MVTSNCEWNLAGKEISLLLHEGDSRYYESIYLSSSRILSGEPPDKQSCNVGLSAATIIDVYVMIVEAEYTMVLTYLERQ